VKSLTETLNSPQCQAASASTRGEMSGLLSLVVRLSEGISPKAEDVSSFTELYKVALKRCEGFHRVEVIETVAAEPGKLGYGSKQVIRGGPAVQRTYEDIRDRVARNDASVNLETLKPLKAFAWLLTHDQVKNVQSWIGLVCSRSLTGGMAGAKCITAGSQGGAPLEICAASSATPSMSSGAASSSSGTARKTKAASAKDDREAKSKENVMRFFVGKR